MAYTARDWADGELVTAEDLDRIEQGLAAVHTKADTTAAVVDQIKFSNTSSGVGPPTPEMAASHPVGWWYIDRSTGDEYRNEA